MKTTPKTETLPVSNIVPSQHSSVGRIPSRNSLGTIAGCPCQNASLLAALWARKLAGFDDDLVGKQRPYNGTIDIELYNCSFKQTEIICVRGDASGARLSALQAKAKRGQAARTRRVFPVPPDSAAPQRSSGRPTPEAPRRSVARPGLFDPRRQLPGGPEARPTVRRVR
jgi:hypothetical protein